MNKTVLYKILSIVAAVAIWQLAASAVGIDFLVASPLTVAQRLGKILTEPDFFLTIFVTLGRIATGFLTAFLLGFLLALLAGRFRFVEITLWPYVSAMKSVPVASFIILCLIWFSYNQLTIFISFLIAFPVIYSNVLQGYKSTDPNLLEVAAVYRIPWYHRFRYMELPAIKPYLLTACGVSTGMAWKAGIAAEVIGVVQNSVGEKLYEAKIYFQTADLFAWTLLIIVLSVAVEKAFLWLLRKAFAGMEKL